MSLRDGKKSSHFRFLRPPSRILTFVKIYLLTTSSRADVRLQTCSLINIHVREGPRGKTFGLDKRQRVLKCSQSPGEVQNRTIRSLTWFLRRNYRMSLRDNLKPSHFSLPRPPSRILTFIKIYLFKCNVFPRGRFVYKYVCRGRSACEDAVLEDK